MKKTSVTCGYLPLVDSAPLIIAKELRFAAEEGIDLTLAQQPSWSALRDRLMFGQIDFAHMLSPMPVAMSLGLGGVSAQIDALMVLSVNGTVIGVSDDMAQRMIALGWVNTFAGPVRTSAALLATTSNPIRIGVPFPFSMHRLLITYWLSKDPGFDPSKVEIITIPPPQMSDALRDGRIDMFCVGEPWGSVAVQESGAILILPSTTIWNFAPEKVLGAQHEWMAQNHDTSLAMVRAVYKATRWLDQPQNTPLAVEILASSEHLDLPDHAIEPALTGQITNRAGHEPIEASPFMSFHDGAVNFPWDSQAQWIAHQLGGVSHPPRCFRNDLYREALAPLGVNLPSSSTKIEGAMRIPTAIASTKGQLILQPDAFFDGAVFDFAREFTHKK
jgi:NitT/TauT family transport system ATP-binding protein